MSDQVQLALIAVLPGLLAGIAVIIKLFKTDQKIDNLSTVVNGKMTELISVTAVSKHAEGKLEGIKEEKQKYSDRKIISLEKEIERKEPNV